MQTLIPQETYLGFPVRDVERWKEKVKAKRLAYFGEYHKEDYMPEVSRAGIVRPRESGTHQRHKVLKTGNCKL